jgi:hypothetical protein
MRKPQHPPRAIKREVLPNGIRVIGHTPSEWSANRK